MSDSHQQSSLALLKSQRLVWQGREHSCKAMSYVSSGYEVFDQALQGGWPGHGVVELNLIRQGIGELRLLLPALALLAPQRPLQVWVNPPACLTPHNLALSYLDRCLVVTPQQDQQVHWVLEQLLASGCCSAVVFWADKVSPAQARRLQVAAKDSDSLAFMIRTGVSLSESLPLSLRMQLEVAPEGLKVSVLKRQNGWPVDPFILDLSTHWPQLFRQQKIQPVVPGPDNIIPFPVVQAEH